MTTALVETTENPAEIKIKSKGKIVSTEFQPASCRCVYNMPAEKGSITVTDLPAEPQEPGQ